MDFKIILVYVALAVSAVFAFTGNMFLGEYTRVFVAIGCVAAGVLLYITTNEKLPENSETIDSHNDLRNQLAAAEIKSAPQPVPMPDIKKELEQIDKQFAEKSKAEPPKPATDLELAKQKQTELRVARLKKDEDPFKRFKE